jgi:Tfp pilus assembly protein PilV
MTRVNLGKWRRPARDEGRSSGRDGGFSVVEVVMAITLIGLVIIPIIDATFTSVRASSTAREAAEVETVLQNAADRVNRANPGCEYDTYVAAAALAKGWRGEQATATYKHYVPDGDFPATVPGTWSDGAGCVNGQPTEIQLVTITVTSDSGTIERTIEVVKSDV